MPAKKFLLEVQNDYFKKFPNSNIVILQLLEKNQMLVKDLYGICKVHKSNLFKGINPSIKSSLNKEEYFTNRIKEKFPQNLNFYKIIRYNKEDNIIVETAYGLCKSVSCDLLNGRIPTIDSSIDKTKFFLNKLNPEYLKRYDFSRFKYINNSTKSELICPKHGLFKSLPAVMLRGNGCSKCGRDIVAIQQASNPSGWSKTNWFKTALKSKYYKYFKVYIIECWNEEERFFKIGRTFINIKQRFTRNKLPYSYKILKIYEYKEISLENATNCYNLEITLKRNNRIYKYIPKIPFEGMQECFTSINELNNDFTTES